MSAPRRLLEDPATSGRLLDALQGYPVTVQIAPEALQALGAVLGHGAAEAGAAGAGATAAGTGGKAGMGVLAKLGAAKLGTVIVAAGLGTAGIYGVSVNTTKKTEAIAAVSSVVAVPVVAQPPPPAVVTETVQAEELEVTGVETKAVHRPNTVVHSASKANPSQLQMEAELLEAARKALASDPRGALKQTARHRAEFSRPLLGVERDLVEIGALCRLGQKARAGTLTSSLLAAQPQGVYAERARALLARGCGNKSNSDVKDVSGIGNH